MKALKQVFFRFFAKRYLERRGRVPAEELQQKTLNRIRKFQETVEALTQEQLDARPDSEGWNAGEITYHAVNSVKGIFRICEGLRNEKDVPPMERTAMGRTKAVLREDLIGLCQKVYGLAEQMDFTTSSKRKCAHPILGPGDTKRWLVINLVHLERHHKQLLRTASLPD